MAYNNATNTNVTGIVTLSSSGAATGSSVTQYGALVGGASNSVASVAPSATSGVPLISQGSSANPAFGTAVVAGGGTGLTSTTAYAVLCGGTTSTGALQSIAGVGTSGQVLTSNGAGALPTFQNAASGGISTVNGDSGSITGSTVTLRSNLSANNCGQTVSFSGSSATMTMNVSDGNNNTFIGKLAGKSGYTGTHNCAVGTSSLAALTSGSYNAACGDNALAAVTGSTSCTAIGAYAMPSLSTGNNNTAVGQGAGSVVNGSANNTFIGAFAGQYDSSQAQNTCLGTNAGPGNGSSGSSYNTFIGYNCGQGGTAAGSANLYIHNGAFTNESNTLRIGESTGTGSTSFNQAFICGIYGITTTSSTTSTVLVSNGNQLGTAASSERFKRDIQDMGDVSSKIMKLRPVTFYYKKHTDNVLQYGLIAEEVMEVMPEIVNLDEEGKPFTVRYHDLPAMMLNEIQKLQKRIEELEDKLS